MFGKSFLLLFLLFNLITTIGEETNKEISRLKTHGSLTEMF
jgi:hypothetical protein